MARDSLARQGRLLAMLRERGELAVAALCEGLAVSEATVRRDLAALESAGEVVRTFGGARAAGRGSLLERTFGQKRNLLRREKEAIAREAARLVSPGMTVALDSGTTTWRVAAALKDKAPLTVLTTALAAVEELGTVAGMRIFCTGGQFRPENLDFVGPSALAAFAQLRADIAFIGADSLTIGKGLYSVDQESAAVLSAIGGCAARRVAVVDHTKIGARGLFLGLPQEWIDCVITDAGLDLQTQAAMAAQCAEMIVAELTA
jgi:DeoR/GlpR family transcriptional regulator of sugar metabolism